MTDLGQLSYFLGLEITSADRGFQLSQQCYTSDLLTRVALSDSCTVDTPMELHLQLRPDDGVPLSDLTRYRHLIGSLVYLTITRPDIAYAVHVLSQFVSSPTSVHMLNYCGFFAIFGRLPHGIFSSPAVLPYSFVLSQMQIGRAHV